MKNTILTVIMLFTICLLTTGQIIRTEGDYIIIPEKDNMRFEFWDEYVSYDLEMNTLGKMPWHSYIRQIIGEKEHILVLHRAPNDAGNAYVTVYDKRFNILKKKTYKRGAVEEIMATDDFFIVRMREKYWGPIYLVAYNWEFEELGRIQKTKFMKEYHLIRDNIVIKESDGRFRSRYYLRCYDSSFKLIGERERKHESY